jgi:hypothetical protein
MSRKQTCCKRYKRKGKACKDCPLKQRRMSLIPELPAAGLVSRLLDPTTRL